jgi:hypothetical protein
MSAFIPSPLSKGDKFLLWDMLKILNYLHWWHVSYYYKAEEI